MSYVKTLGGVEVIISSYAPRTAMFPDSKVEVDQLYDDWQERLARNLARPSTGKWEPLYYKKDVTKYVEKEAIFLINKRALFMEEQIFRALSLGII